MNLNQLRGTLVQHRTTLLVAGAAGVAGFALLRRHQAAGAAGGGTDSTVGTSAADQPVDGSGGYSSAPYDTYDSIISQLQALQDQINNQGDPTPAPVTSSGGSLRRPNGYVAPGWATIRTRDNTTRVQVPPAPAGGSPVGLPHPGTHY